MWFVIPCTPKGKCWFVPIEIIALGQEEDDINVSVKVNVGDQVELGVYIFQAIFIVLLVVFNTYMVYGIFILLLC